MTLRTDRLKIGVISDTHGSLPKDVYAAFRGVDHIFHAGDIGREDVLFSLQAIAPITAVYGNMDGFAVRKHARLYQEFRFREFRFFIVHVRGTVDTPPVSSNEWLIMISGHTHQPDVSRQGRVLYVNPGSAVNPRGHAHPTVCLLQVQVGREPEATLVRLPAIGG